MGETHPIDYWTTKDTVPVYTVKSGSKINSTSQRKAINLGKEQIENSRKEFAAVLD